MRNAKPNSRTKSPAKGKTLRRAQRFSMAQLLAFAVIFAAIGGYIIYISLAASRGGHSSGIGWSPSYHNILTYLDTPEPYGAVPHNNTGCVWNDADEMMHTGTGDLSGASTDDICLVSDYGTGEEFFPKSVVVKVFSPSDTLAVKLSNDENSSWNSQPAIQSGHQYLYQLCINDPVAIKGGVGWGDTNGLLNTWQEVPNTGGGYGRIVHYTLSLTSLKGTTHKISAEWEIGMNGSATHATQYIQRTSPVVPCPPANQVTL